MNFDSITLRGFTNRTDEVTVTLPPTGVVLVTGDNGAGKSSIVEAASVCVWGRTLRGTGGWRAKESGRVAVSTREGLTCERARTKQSRVTVDWSTAGVTTPSFETTTKAQDALEAIVGPWEVWRRTCVFSSHDASHFTMATDAERKRFLETVLGLDRFDEALDACREDKKRANRALEALKGNRVVTQTRRDAEQRRVDEARVTLASIPGATEDVAALEVESRRLHALHDSAGADLTATRAELRKADTAGADIDARLRSLRQTLAVIRGDKCPTCTRPFLDRSLRDGIEAQAVALDHEHQRVVAAARADVSDVEAQIAELEAERAALVPRVADLDRRLAAARLSVTQRARMTGIAKQAQDALDKLDQDLADLDAQTAASERGVKTLDACDKVLGMKGVRANVLASALGGLEAVANGWLARLAGPGLRVVLKSYSETKAGKITESLGLDIEGAGGGEGYPASSGGERRRIDLALLLALADVAAAAYGRPQGTIFADEVFDALDADGRDHAIEVLTELSQDRCVVVISHSPALASALSPVRHLRVTAGAVVG